MSLLQDLISGIICSHTNMVQIFKGYGIVDTENSGWRGTSESLMHLSALKIQ
jgi:hypothetical protein